VLTRTDNIAVRFLRLILPEQGYYAVAIKNPRSKGFKPTEFAASIEELGKIIADNDRDEYVVYHACASFNEALNDPPGTAAREKRFGRTQRNARGAQSFWLDIDAGQGKDYSSQVAAHDAVMLFCQKTGLPLPIIVDSGWGLHVYWPRKQMLDHETWTYYARGLKNLCHKHGLRADPSRTIDIASVLRTPGTHNRKHGTVREVTVDPEFLNIERYPIETFALLAEHADTPKITKRGEQTDFDPNGLFTPGKLLGDLSYLRRPKPEWLTKHFLIEEIYPPSSGAQVAENCAQLATLRNRKGNLPEPLWYAALGVLAFCEDGDLLAHEWSSGDARYTQRATQERLDRARTLTGATKCETFHEKGDPMVCKRCPWWGKITSPIVLGRQAPQPQGTQSFSPRTLLQWERTQGGALKPRSYVNARLALQQLGLRFRHDLFHDKKIVEGGGDAIENLGPQLSDAMVRALRDTIIERFRFDPGLQNTREAAERACEENRFDPVLDYLDPLHWDRHPRLDRWLITYMGAEGYSTQPSDRPAHAHRSRAACTPAGDQV
jgi:hypothetical protein